ncbi:MAG: biotin--[acetyl-CoA-carboxylase] ligase [Brevinematia bacterium]
MRKNRKNEILQKLLHTHNFVSGEEISKSLNISRVMVNRYIKELTKEGFEIEAQKNKGYKLNIIPDVIYKSLIEDKLNNTKYNIIILDEVDSTNSFAISNIEKLQDRTVIIAKNQVLGKGRMGRSWISEKDKDITMSIILKPNIQIDNLFKYIVYTSLAVFKSLKDFDIDDIFIKWPNDIIYKNKKLCGILIETTIQLETKVLESIVIGVGLNVNSKISERIPTATSVSEILGFEVKRDVIISKILNNFENLLSSDFEKTFNEWKERVAYIGKEIILSSIDGDKKCKLLDVSKTGEIVVEEEGGTLKIYTSGEISLSSSLQ